MYNQHLHPYAYASEGTSQCWPCAPAYCCAQLVYSQQSPSVKQVQPWPHLYEGKPSLLIPHRVLLQFYSPGSIIANHCTACLVSQWVVYMWCIVAGAISSAGSPGAPPGRPAPSHGLGRQPGHDTSQKVEPPVPPVLAVPCSLLTYKTHR